jgi:hypothetical protein
MPHARLQSFSFVSVKKKTKLKHSKCLSVRTLLASEIGLAGRRASEKLLAAARCISVVDMATS